MQTYTHAAIGAVVAEAFFHGNYAAEAACVVMAVIPDLTMVPQYIKDLVARRQPMTEQSASLMQTKEIGHSFPVWVVLMTIAFFLPQPFQTIGVAGALGGLSHVIVDVYTHGTGPKEKRPYWDTDVKFMWPTGVDLRPLGIWEYRKAHGDLTPKLPELLVLIMCSVFVGVRVL